MARLNAAGKAQRVMEFLLGLRDERVSAALVGCGFTHAERAKGWQLLQALGMTDLGRDVRQHSDQPFAKLDAWQNQWIRVAKVSLQRDYPRVYDQYFQSVEKVAQASTLAVPVFVRQFEKLTRAKDEDSKAALVKLRRRGLSPERMEEGQQLAAQAMQLGDSAQPAPNLELRRAAIENAEAALWDYYVEWSQLARTVIKDMRLLKLIGFRGGASDDGDVEASATAMGTTPELAVAAETAKPVATGRRVARGRKARKRVR